MSWIASLSSAAIIASFGATAVLAEGPECIVGDRPATQEELANPDLCPQQAAPAPVEPAPVEPTPEPTPEPEPTDEPDVPAPDATTPDAGTETPAAPADPADPVEADPATPAPDASTPGTTTGGTTQPAPVTRVPRATTPKPTTTAPEDPTPTTTAPEGGDPKPTKPRPVRRPRQERPAAPRPIPATPTRPAERTQALVRAKQFQAAPFRDARLFREQFEPKGRIPAQPKLKASEAKLLRDAAKGTGTSWSTLAAVAWLESRWGDPSAGGLVGRRLTPAAWKAYGTDGNGDGTVDRANAADQARTVAVFLAEARSVDERALQAYFNGTRREVMAERAMFLADYFAALGSKAVVDGLDDPEVRKQLQERVLADDDIEIYDGGRSDIDAGLVDPRVLVTMRFLANRFDTVTISSIISGHGVYTSGGNVSLHSYGQAIDIAALDGESILGHQQRGSNTYRAVQEILLLPKAMQPAELISLWDMGGASFAASDHHDHIHVGWKTETGPTFGEDEHGH